MPRRARVDTSWSRCRRPATTRHLVDQSPPKSQWHCLLRYVLVKYSGPTHTSPKARYWHCNQFLATSVVCRRSCRRCMCVSWKRRGNVDWRRSSCSNQAPGLESVDYGRTGAACVARRGEVYKSKGVVCRNRVSQRMRIIRRACAFMKIGESVKDRQATIVSGLRNLHPKLASCPSCRLGSIQGIIAGRHTNDSTEHNSSQTRVVPVVRLDSKSV